ncbi:MAG: KH domain-containing protein [Candidatus Pacearchaeota archaeon]|nr:KH domain-containing protein [Candidatus Pacearchaeota archaeon]
MRKLLFSGKELYRLLNLRSKIKKLEARLKVRVDIDKKEVILTSMKKDSFSEYVASKVLEAIALGFDTESAMQLCNTDFTLTKINAKDFVRSSRVNLALGRIIGKEGRTKRIIEELSNCNLVVSNHTVAVIGRADNVDTARQAIISLLHGSKQANVYKFLERSRARLRKLEEEDVEKFIEKEKPKTSSEK